MDETLISMIGAGSANTAVLKVLIAAGVKPGNVIMCDISGILHPDRKDFESGDPRYNFCQITNGEGRKGGMPEAMKGTDVCIAYSAPGPGTIKKEWVASMATDPIIFSCANPVPEIWPWEAKEGGAKIVATGRSDFPNQVNNSLGFPGIFRGVLDVRAKMITDEMCVAAAEEVAKVAEEKGLSEKYIIPDMDEWEVYPKEAVAVGMKAIEQGIAKVKLTKDELYEKAERIIKRSREQTQFLMRHGFIKPPPEER
jgi:Malic enzyme